MDILDASRTPIGKTRIMYKSNLNFARFHKYFDDLVEKGFVEEMNNSNGRAVYKTTERGRELMEVLKLARDLLYSTDASS